MNNRNPVMRSNKLFTIKKNYFTDGGDTNNRLIDFSNPFAGSGGRSAINSVLGAAGSAVGGIAGNAISGGLSSGAGNVVSGLSSVASAIPGPWGAVASAGLGVVGGLVNRMFGTKWNEANIAAANERINSAQSFTSNASDYDTLAATMSNTAALSGFNDSYIGKDGWFSNKAKRKAADLRRKTEIADARQSLSLVNNAENIAGSTMSELQANYAALGGSLNLFNKGGGIHIDPKNRGKFNATKKKTGKTTEELTHSKNPLTRKRAIFAQNARKWHHAFGGELNTNGGDFTNGMVYINNGGDHEANPLEGVPIGVDEEGTPNLVEEGETIFNDYVFSKRLVVPSTIRKKYKLKGGKFVTFADASKQLAKESEERPNDPISLRGLEAMMLDLAEAQENVRASKEGYSNEYARGGKMGKLYDGTGSMSNMIRTSNGSQRDYWSGLVGNQLINRLTQLNSLQGNARDQAISDFVSQANGIQDSYYSDIYNSGVTWGGNALRGAGKNHQELWNTAGYNTYQDYDKYFGSRGSTSDRADTWVDNNIGDLTLLRNLGDSRYLDPNQAQTIRDLSSKLGLNYMEKGDGNTLMYFRRNQPGIVDSLSFDPLSSEFPTPRDVIPRSTPTDLPSDAGVTTPPPRSGKDYKYKPLPTWLRYAPVAGLGVAAITDALGLTNKPDYSNADAVLAATSTRGSYQPVRFKPIGNYLRYTPFDRDYYINKLNAESGATRRAVLQNAGLNRGAGMAAILAADNNAQNQLGQLARQAEEYNLAQRQQVEDFNRNTNITNSRGFLQADIANQEAQAKLRDFSLKGTLAAAEMKERARMVADQAKSANLSRLFESLGEIGRENEQYNWRNLLYNSGALGNVREDYEDFLGNTGKKATRAKRRADRQERREERRAYRQERKEARAAQRESSKRTKRKFLTR